MAWEKKESHGTFIRGSEERKDQYHTNTTSTSHQHQSTSNLHLQHIRCSIFNMWTTFPLPPDALSCNQILTLLSSITMTLPTPSLRTYMHTTYTHTSTHPHTHQSPCMRQNVLPSRQTQSPPHINLNIIHTPSSNFQGHTVCKIRSLSFHSSKSNPHTCSTTHSTPSSFIRQTEIDTRPSNAMPTRESR